jgi:signal transduction histidine kinase
VRSALVSIVSNIHRANQILNNTRALFAGADKGHESIDVNKIAVQVLRLLREQLKAKGIVVHVELASDLPLVVGHKGQLQEVVINLVQNAIEAMNTIKDGRRAVQLRTRRHGDDAIVVEVEDSGTGIDPADLNSIFDAFFTTKSHGAGLGLAICRMIIERHGGRLSASSDGTNGALFQVILPTREVRTDNRSALHTDKHTVPITAK